MTFREVITILDATDAVDWPWGGKVTARKDPSINLEGSPRLIVESDRAQNDQVTLGGGAVIKIGSLSYVTRNRLTFTAAKTQFFPRLFCDPVGSVAVADFIVAVGDAALVGDSDLQRDLNILRALTGEDAALDELTRATAGAPWGIVEPLKPEPRKIVSANLTAAITVLGNYYNSDSDTSPNLDLRGWRLNRAPIDPPWGFSNFYTISWLRPNNNALLELTEGLVEDIATGTEIALLGGEGREIWAEFLGADTGEIVVEGESGAEVQVRQEGRWEIRDTAPPAPSSVLMGQDGGRFTIDSVDRDARSGITTVTASRTL